MTGLNDVDVRCYLYTFCMFFNSKGVFLFALSHCDKYASKKNYFYILRIYFFLGSIFFWNTNYTEYTGGILSRRYCFQEVFCLGGIFPVDVSLIRFFPSPARSRSGASSDPHCNEIY